MTNHNVMETQRSKLRRTQNTTETEHPPNLKQSYQKTNTDPRDIYLGRIKQGGGGTQAKGTRASSEHVTVTA